MSLFAKMFGKKDPKQVTPGEAIQKLRDIEEMLNKKQEFLEKKIDQEIANARKNATKNKRLALMALKRKKRLGKQLQQIDGTLSTIEFQREALENANTNTEVLKGMGAAAQAMKAAHNNMDVDKVHDIMDDIAEQQELSNEISDAISKPAGFDQDIDEDELEAELEELQQEDLDEQLLQVGEPPAVSLPSVPTDEPAKASSKQTEDDELKELEAWAS